MLYHTHRLWIRGYLMSDTNSSVAGPSVSIWPTVWKYALILAAFKVAWNLLLWTTGLSGVSGIGLVSFVISTVLLVIGLKSFRGRNAGLMTFGQGFGIAYVASVVSVVVSGVVGSIYLASFGREQLVAAREASLAQLQTNPAVDAQTLEMMRGIFDAVMTPGGLFVMGVVGGAIGWAVVSLILAAVLKNPPPITD